MNRRMFHRGRRGVTAVLAMLFMVLFAVMAVGFYATTNTAYIVADNEKRIHLAQTACEGGVDFMRWQLSRIKLPPTTLPEDAFPFVAAALKANLEGTGNLGPNPVAVTASTVSIPAHPDAYIRADEDDAEFRAEVESMGQQIRVKVIGRVRGYAVRRAVQLDYARTENTTKAFSYAVASRGRVVMQKGSITGVPGVSSNAIASVVSARPAAAAISVSGGTIGGDLNVTAAGLASVTGGSVGGTSSIAAILEDHTHVVQPPEFPTIDTTVFKPLATNTYTGGNLLKNVRIPPNTNPKFTGGALIQGILYIESPNTVEFRGNVQLQGFIVVEQKGTVAQNVIDMRGNFSHSPLPGGPEFDPLRFIKGISILAPTTRMVISGSVDSLLKGNVILGVFNNGGSADWTIDQGTLMTMETAADSAVFNGKTVKFRSTGANNKPNFGVNYSSTFRPNASSYEEVAP